MKCSMLDRFRLPRDSGGSRGSWGHCEGLEFRRLLCTLHFDSWDVDGPLPEYVDRTPEVDTGGLIWSNRGSPTNDSDGFNAAFGTVANAARSVVDAAFAAWRKVIVNFNQDGGNSQLDVTVNAGARGSGVGGSGGVNTRLGNKPRTSSVNIGGGTEVNGIPGIQDGEGYFIDPTPFDNDEFQFTPLNPYVGVAASGAAATNWDLFSLVTVEIQHALGFEDRYTDLAWRQNPGGYITNTNVNDAVDTPGKLYTYNSPGGHFLLTSNNGGAGGQDRGWAVHTARPNNTYTGGYSGIDDTGVAVYFNGRRHLPSAMSAIMLRDTYGYSIISPNEVPNFHNMLLSDGTLLIRGGGGNSADRVSVSRFGSTIFADIDLGNDVPGSAPTDWLSTRFTSQVQRIRIETGDGNDNITLVALDSIPVTVSGGGGSDWLDIREDAGDNTLTFTSSTITGARNNITSYSGLEEIYAYGQGGNDTFNVNSLPNLSLYMYGEDGNDQVTWGGAGGLGVVVGGGAFIAGAGADTMIVNDAAHAGTRTYTFSLGWINDGGSNYNYVNGGDLVENVIINGAAGAGSFNCDALFSGVNYTINGGNGSDAINMGGNFQNVTATAQGYLTVNAGGGSDTLTFNDQGGSSDFIVGLTDVFFTGTPGIVHYNAGLENIVVNGGNSGNFFNIDGGGGQVVTPAVQINAGGGNDTIQLAHLTLSLANLGADVTVDGQGGYDAFYVHNQNGAQLTEALSPTSVNANHTYTYGGIEFLSIDLSQFDDTMYVGGTAAGVSTVIYGNNGNDLLYALTTDLSGIFGLNFQGQGGTDSVVLNDQAATGTHTYDVNLSTITRGTFSLSYSTVESVELNASNGDDTVNLAVPGAPLTINANDGNDTINLTDVAGTTIVNGGAGLNTINQNEINDPITAFWRTLITDTQVRRQYRTGLSGPYTQYSAVSYSQIHSYIVTAAYYSRFEVTSTPASTNIAVNGPADGALFRVGSASLVGNGTGNLDNIRGLLQFFGAPGAFNTVIIDDGADATADTARVVPNLVYNGPGAPLFAAGGSVNFYNVSSATLYLGGGGDTVYATPSSQYPVTIHGQNPTTAPGDALNLAFAAVTNPVFTPNGTGAGSYTFGNAQTLTYSGFESTAIDAVAPAVLARAFDFDGPAPAVEFTFSEDVSSQLTAGYLTLTNVTTSQQIPVGSIALSYDAPNNRARFTFPGLPGGLLPDGNYHGVLSGQVPDLFGNPIGQDQTLDFFVLGGDANRDRTVNISDFSILASRFNLPGTFSQGDFDYSGTVGIGDFSILASKFNTSLPAPSLPMRAGWSPAAAPARLPFSTLPLIGDALELIPD